jgi:hypothetical protein
MAATIDRSRCSDRSRRSRSKTSGTVIEGVDSDKEKESSVVYSLILSKSRSSPTFGIAARASANDFFGRALNGSTD